MGSRKACKSLDRAIVKTSVLRLRKRLRPDGAPSPQLIRVERDGIGKNLAEGKRIIAHPGANVQLFPDLAYSRFISALVETFLAQVVEMEPLWMARGQCIQ